MLYVSGIACPEAHLAKFPEHIRARIRAVVDQAPSFDECPRVAAKLAAIIATIPEPAPAAAA